MLDAQIQSVIDDDRPDLGETVGRTPNKAVLKRDYLKRFPITVKEVGFVKREIVADTEAVLIDDNSSNIVNLPSLGGGNNTVSTNGGRSAISENTTSSNVGNEDSLTDKLSTFYNENKNV